MSFEADPSQFNSDILLSSDEDDGAQYTNNKIVDLNFVYDSSLYTSLKVSFNEDLTDSVDYEPQNRIKFDLGDKFAADGSKDGLKKIYIKLTSKINSIKLIEHDLYLDTVPPQIDFSGILNTGLNGKAYALNESVQLSWDANDVNALSGYSSGLHKTESLRIATTKIEDCSENNVSRADWRGYKKSLDISWPQENQNETFYFCVYLKDRAGNISTSLSQPMSSVWRVLAGENNQGNGGSFNTPNVRLQYPTTLAKSSDGQLFISDSKFNNIRKITADNNRNLKNISAFAGTGLTAGPAASGQGLELNLGGGVDSIVFNDSRNEAYVSISARGVYRVKFNQDKSTGEFQKIISANLSRITKREVNGLSTLIITNSQDFTVENPSAMSYIYEIPMSTIEAMDSDSSIETLDNFIIAGNGVIPFQSYSVPATVDLIKNSSASDLSQSLGRIRSVFVDDSGTIYIGTHADGSGNGWGNHTLRRLEYRPNGSLRQTLLSTRSWIYKIYVLGTKVYMSSNQGFFVYDTNDGSELLLKSGITYGVYVDEVSSEIYLSESYRSQIGVYDLAMNFKYYIGRSIYEEDEPDALKAMIGQAHGLVETPDDELVYIDSVSHSVRKVASDGKRITTLTGGLSNDSYEDFTGSRTFDEFTFNGTGSTSNGYNLNLFGDFRNGNQNILMSVSEGSLYNLDLKARSVDSVLNRSERHISELSNTSINARLYGFAVNENTGQLLVSKAFNTARTSADINGFAGYITSSNLQNKSLASPEVLYAGDLSIKDSNSLRVNPGNYVNNSNLSTYLGRTVRFSNDSMAYAAGGYLQILNLDTNRTKSVYLKSDPTVSFTPQYIEVVPDGDDDLIFYIRGTRLSYVRINREQAQNTNDTILVEPQELCLPGTFLNNAQYLKKANDGNLLISDTENGRILKYFIMSSGRLDIQPSCG